MAYDGIFIKAQISEIKKIILNEHISKITQNLSKEISFHIRKNGENLIFTLDANPNFPHLLLHKKIIDNRNTPTSFCMLLRKYLQGGQILKINQIGKGFSTDESTNYLERIIKVEIKNIDENGDLKKYFIIFEVMGKYSNIIITDDKYIIIDVLIKSHIENARLKSKNKYEIDSISNKCELLTSQYNDFKKNIESEKTLSKLNNEIFDISNSISKKYAGISKPYIINSMLNIIKSTNENLFFNYNSLNNAFLDNNNLNKLYNDLKKNLSHEIRPCINYKHYKPSDFYLFKLNQFEGDVKYFDSLNELIIKYISEKHEKQNQLYDKNLLNEVVKKIFTKLNKKLDIYKSDLSKCNNYEKYKKYGELISAFGYNKENIKNDILICTDYNNNNQIINIPIDTTISISKNIEKYYNKYNKLKRTIEKCNILINQILEKIEHLSTIEKSIILTDNKNDLEQIKVELLEYFEEAHSMNLSKNSSHIKRNLSNKKNLDKKHAYILHHYKSSSGIDIYLGKNNLQNEYLTFTLASPNDTWLHIKNSTGSHVIVKKPYENLDDKTLIEAASLAAYFSDKREETKATVDYTLRKELKKVKGKAPGFCIYHKNYSINVKPEILIKEI